MDEFVKYDKIRPIGYDETKDIFVDDGDFIYVEEKIDGGNFRFTIKNDKIILGTRTQQITSDEGDEVNVNKQFSRCAGFVKKQIMESQTTLSDLEGFIFYGECCVKHTMSYDWEKIPPFLGFDIFDISKNKFVSYDDKEELFNELNLEMVPLVATLTCEDAIAFVKDIDNKIPVSKYSPKLENTFAEGVVFKNYNKQIFAKYVRDEFKEMNGLAFGSTPKFNKRENDDNAEILFKYVTNQRIEKMIFKLIDEGSVLDNSLMHQLPRRVWEDIVDEEGPCLLNSNYTINLMSLKKTIPRRCFSVLTTIITNNVLNSE